MNRPASPIGAAILDRLDPLLQHRSRLGALVLLSDVDAATFVHLRQSLGETDGNLGAQLRKLEEAGHLTVRKAFEDRKPVSWYSITPAGRSALRRHLDALEELIRAAKV